MSVMQLSANHVYAVAVGVAKLLNNVPAVNYVFFKGQHARRFKRSV